MKPRTRTYEAIGDADRYVRRVICTETYRDSQHWWVVIIPEGYGSDPQPIVFAKKTESGWSVEQEEGYGHFRPEYAFAIARLLTGNTAYSETQ
jgi:hypothetical protein